MAKDQGCQILLTLFFTIEYSQWILYLPKNQWIPMQSWIRLDRNISRSNLFTFYSLSSPGPLLRFRDLDRIPCPRVPRPPYFIWRVKMDSLEHSDHFFRDDIRLEKFHGTALKKVQFKKFLFQRFSVLTKLTMVTWTFFRPYISSEKSNQWACVKPASM